MQINDITVRFATPEEAKYADKIVRLIYESALQRGTGIANVRPNTLPKRLTAAKV